MKKITLVLAIFLIVSMILSGCVAQKAEPVQEEKPELVVGMELAYPPFEMTDEKGEPTGISVELAYALGEYLGRPVRIENMAFSGLIPALTTGKIDIILSSMTITEERKKTVAFSDPYCRSYLALLVAKDSPVEKAEDLNVAGRIIAVKKGTTGHIYSLENFSQAEVRVFEKESACVLEVAQGRADAFIYDQMTIYKNNQLYPEETRALLQPFQKDFEYWGIALQKEGTEELSGEINAFLNSYREAGGFDKLAEKYLKEIKDKFAEEGIPFFF